MTPALSDIFNGVDVVVTPSNNSLDGDCDMALVTMMDQPPSKFGDVAKVMPSMDAVVKVFCVHTEPNFSLPWQRKRQFSSSSSGFIISDRRVLTNAHSVEHSTQVKLKKRGSDTKYLATILAIGTECDIGELLFLLKKSVWIYLLIYLYYSSTMFSCCFELLNLCLHKFMFSFSPILACYFDKS